ncbi:hypothetical protein QBC44DRAFT_317321 [Cladorrhinum sp. PSN332]|nr:hypothetical protein QBC44DRAFT_317321 [Cladorrhinum sp. PSN332]
MAASPPPPAGGGMSLYANLLDTADNSASISREAVNFSESKEDAPAKKFINPALQFQPIRRPQLKQPNRLKPGFPKPPPAVSAAATATGTGTAAAPTTTTTAPPALAQPRSTLADWAAAEDDDYGYAEREKRQRGGRRKKKKKANEQLETNWDEIYDPTRPTNVEEYLRSEERIREVREWKAVLYAHRRRSSREQSYSDEEDDRPRMGLGNQFAPPSSFSFAPPPLSPPRPAAATAPDDLTGDDAYARRLALSQMPQPPPPPPPPPAEQDTATISRAPVRYSPPPPPPPPDDNDDAMSIGSKTKKVNYSSISIPMSNSSTPLPEGKTRGKAFAKKLMSKYGWTAGTGLGASNSGITAALRVETIKRRKKPDSEGGGYADPKGLGRIIAPKSNTNKEENGNAGLGKMSTVICLSKMLDNMENLEEEIAAGLGQEIGEECGEKYGRVERVNFEVGDEGNEGERRVFIQFVEGVSALRAVNALQGRIFNGNVIEAKFFDEEKFERGEYE